MIDYKIDDGLWTNDAKVCKCPQEGQIILWGGPEVVFKWVSVADMDIQKMSVREITRLLPYDQIS
jgi:hypothetical protein